jgi:hypothetical protein
VERRRWARGRALDQLADGRIAEMLSGMHLGDRHEHALAWMFTVKLRTP